MARSSATARPPTERPMSSHMTQVAPIIAKLVSFCWMSMIESPVGVGRVRCRARVRAQQQQPACHRPTARNCGAFGDWRRRCPGADRPDRHGQVSAAIALLAVLGLAALGCDGDGETGSGCPDGGACGRARETTIYFDPRFNTAPGRRAGAGPGRAGRQPRRAPAFGAAHAGGVHARSIQHPGGDRFGAARGRGPGVAVAAAVGVVRPASGPAVPARSHHLRGLGELRRFAGGPAAVRGFRTSPPRRRPVRAVPSRR